MTKIKILFSTKDIKNTQNILKSIKIVNCLGNKKNYILLPLLVF